MPQFAEAGSSELRPLDLPECEEQSLDIVAQYAQQAWIKRDVAIVPVALGAAITASTCVIGFIAGFLDEQGDESLIFSTATGGIIGGSVSIPVASIMSNWSFRAAAAATIGSGAVFGAIGGLVCSGIANGIFYE